MSDARLLLEVESRKKSAGVAALLNLLLPGAGYMYCGRYLIGVLAFIVTVIIAVVTAGLGWFFMTLVLIIDGVLSANKYNQELVKQVLLENSEDSTVA